MEIGIHEINQDNQTDFGHCAMAFTVTSKLILSATDAQISYTVVDLSPYTKNYGPRHAEWIEYNCNPNKTIFLAYAEAELAGEVRIAKHWNSYALLDDFVVEPKFRRQGVGRALIQRCIEWAKDKSFVGITLETQDINVPACRLYESCGFKLRGFDTHLYNGLNLFNDEIALFWYLDF
jgi:streptothricin acetyltransferase